MKSASRYAFMVFIQLLAAHASGGASADSPYGVVHGDRTSFLVEGGFSWTRVDFNWNAIEPQNGTFTFEQYDSFVENCTRAGIHVLAILDYSANWASSGPPDWKDIDRFPPKYMSDWEEYVFQTVSHFKDRVKHWEVWNEPNIRYFWFPKADAKEYYRLLKSAYAAAKRADPECTVLIGGIIGFDVRYLREVYELGGARFFDVMAIHPYSAEPYDRCNFSGNMSALRSLMAEYGDSKKEIWFTELSWTVSQNLSKDDQAAYLIRSYVLSFAEGADKLFWFNLNAAPPPEESSGLIEHDLTPRPAFWAHKALADIVGPAEYRCRVKLGTGIHAHLFHREGTYVMVLWAPNETAEVRLRMASRSSSPRLWDMFGKAIQPSIKGRFISLEASPHPIFISNLSEDDVQALLARRGWIPFVSLAALVAAVGCSMAYLWVRRRRGPAPTQRADGEKPPTRSATKFGDVPAECQKAFKDTVCLKCRHYVIQGGTGRCRKFGIRLD